MKPVLQRFDEIWKNPPERDFHIHTDFADGTSSVQEYLKSAKDHGIEEIAFTEHVQKSSSWYFSFVDTVEELRESYKGSIRIFHGIEAKILNLDGELDATDEMLETAEIILGSVHRFPESLRNNSVDNHKIDAARFAETEYQLSSAILEKSDADVLAHPGGMYLRKFGGLFPRRYLQGLIERANRYNKAVEINSSYLEGVPLDVDLFYQLNPKVSQGSDAHNVRDLGVIIKFMNNQIKA